jgi:hypothetical protein
LRSWWSRGERWLRRLEKRLDFEWISEADTIYKIKEDSIMVFNKKKSLAKLSAKCFELDFANGYQQKTVRKYLAGFANSYF